MEIETELPENFDQLSPEQKVQKLEEIKKDIQDSSDSGALKERLVEEMIRTCSEDL